MTQIMLFSMHKAQMVTIFLILLTETEIKDKIPELHTSVRIM